MSKELTPLEALENIVNDYYIDNKDKELEIIETALKDFERLKEWIDERGNLINECIEIIAEKKLKALEIIKEKIDVGVVVLGDKPKIRITYNGQLRFYDIAQKEFDLLEEVLL